MMIERIRLCELKSYRDLTLELRPGINVIAGPNGAGKSTVVEAIGIALFDSWPPWAEGRHAQLIRRGAKTATIELTVRHAGERFRVERVLGGSKARWTVFDDAGQALTSGQIGETAEWLRRRLGSRDVAMDKLFADIVGTYQGHFTTPFEAPPADRTRVFEKILQVDGWKAMAIGLGERARAALDERRHAALRDMEGLRQKIADRSGEAAEVEARAGAAERAELALAEAAAELARATQAEEGAAQAEEAVRGAAEALRGALAAAARDRGELGRARAAEVEAQAAAAERERTRAGAEAHARAEAARRVADAERGERDRAERERARLGTELAALRAAAEELRAAAEARGSRLAGEEAEAGRLRGEAEAAFTAAEAAAREAQTALERHRAEALAPAQAELEAARQAAREAEALAALASDARARGMALAAGPLAKLRRWDETAALAATRDQAEAAAREVRAELATLEARLADKRTLAERARGGRCPMLDEGCPHPRGLDLAGSVAADAGLLAGALAEARARLEGRLEPALAAALEAAGRLQGLTATAAAAGEEAARMRQALETHARRARALAELPATRVKPGEDVRSAGFVEALERLLAQAEARQRTVEAAVRARVEAAALADTAAQAAARALEQRRGATQEAAGAARGRVAEARRLGERVSQARRDHAGELERARLAREAATEVAAQAERAAAAVRRFAGLDERLAGLLAELEARRDEHLAYERAGALAAALGERVAAAAAAERRLREDERAAAEAARRAREALVADLADAELPEACERARALRRAEAEAARRQIATLRGIVSGLERAATLAVKDLATAREARLKIEAWQVELGRLEARRMRVEETLRVAKGIADHVLKRAGARIAERQVERVAAEAAELYRRIAPHENLQLRWSPVDYGIELCGRIDDHEDTLMFQQLSGGQKMTAALAVRLALVRAFAGGLGFVCLDEPTTHLDPERRGELAEALARLFRGRAEGAAWFEQLFLVSHDDAFEALDECRITLALDPTSKATKLLAGGPAPAPAKAPAALEAGPVRRKRPAVGR